MGRLDSYSVGPRSQSEPRGRVGRGRSLSLPPPGGRAAIFTPLVLQLQDPDPARYIPLRPLRPKHILS
ncbi:hypothetical protein Pmani_036274 [Petrolisthes manimaculis]|nr:hypothetical protein Pmani_036274 [Petrolisthes manimaculis]